MKDTTLLRLEEEINIIESRVTQYSKEIEAAKALIENLEQKLKEDELRLNTLKPFLEPNWTTIHYNQVDKSPINLNLEDVRDFIIDSLTRNGRKRSGEMADEFIKGDDSKRDLFHNVVKNMVNEGKIFRISEPGRKRNFAYQLNTNP